LARSVMPQRLRAQIRVHAPGQRIGHHQHGRGQKIGFDALWASSPAPINTCGLDVLVQ
jgi:hypothetical protein